MNGHGTSVAGIIGAKNNGKGYVGVAPDCLLYGVKAAPDSQAAGIEPIEVGFNWLVTQGVKIISMSLDTVMEAPLSMTHYLMNYITKKVFFL